MTTALIADDEPFMRDVLREQLLLLWPDLVLLADACDGPSALLQIETQRPDIAFLDIRMPGLSGLQVARAVTVPTRIVFVTAYDAHAVDAFEANAVDYVLKPVEMARLSKVVAKLRQSIAQPSSLTLSQLTEALTRLGMQAPAAPPASSLEWFQVSVGQQVHMVHVDDVRYFESDTKYTRVVAEGTDGLIRASLKELMEQLDPQQFVQTHRSTVVNRRFVRVVHRRGEVLELELRGTTERLKVSTANHHLFKAM
jgi:DNA-binding LytR/AlgR family response regulator